MVNPDRRKEELVVGRGEVRKEKGITLKKESIKGPHFLWISGFQWS